MTFGKNPPQRWQIQDFIAVWVCTVMLCSSCTDAGTIRITNVIHTPASTVGIECQSTTRAKDWAAKEISANETYSLSFTPSVILFNTEIWCDALRVSDGASAHFRVYRQKVDWPFTPSMDWDLHSDELRRRPTYGGLSRLDMRLVRFLMRSMGLWSLFTF